MPERDPVALLRAPSTIRARCEELFALAEADQLRREIRALGNVNLEAMDELGELETRNEDLAGQLADIDDAKRQSYHQTAPQEGGDRPNET